MITLKIDKLSKQTTNKDGELLINKFGKPFAKISVNANDRWYSCFDSDWINILAHNKIQEAKVGDTIEVNVVENGKYLNISAPKAGRVDTTELMEKLGKISEDINKILFLLQGLESKL